jgi:uncharacterized membrane-anchored protein
VRTNIFDEEDNDISVEGVYYPEERGSRDYYGAPIEPDIPARVTVEESSKPLTKDLLEIAEQALLEEGAWSDDDRF